MKISNNKQLIILINLYFLGSKGQIGVYSFFLI